MAVTFDGTNLIMTLPSATPDIDSEVDLYSDWKEWVKGTGHLYAPAFRSIAGDPLNATLDAAPYFFIRNDFGWRIRPAEENATVFITGSLIAEDSTLPIIIPTIGAYTVLILGLQPVTQNVDILTQADGVETGYTLQDAMRLLLAGDAGDVSGAPAGPILIKNPDGTKTRITATVDGQGNRTITARDLS